MKNRGEHVQLAALHCIGQLSEVTVGATGQGGQVGFPSTGSFLMVCKRRVSLAEVQEKDAVLAKMATIEEGFTF